MDCNFIFNRQEQSKQVERFVIHSMVAVVPGASEVSGGCDTQTRKEIRANGGCLGYPEARKDVVSCDKRRGTANRF